MKDALCGHKPRNHGEMPLEPLHRIDRHHHRAIDRCFGCDRMRVLDPERDDSMDCVTCFYREDAPQPDTGWRLLARLG